MNDDCSCTNHTGPHWLHLDHIDRQRNLSLLEQSVTALEANNYAQSLFIQEAFAREELFRLTEKMRNMALSGLIQTKEREDLNKQEQALYARIRKYREGKIGK